jgi:branched-chain amino acid aminotransferase
MTSQSTWDGREKYSVWINGEIHSPEEAKIEVWDHGLLYGDGCFEGLRLKDNRLFRPHLHLERLFRSAKALSISLPYEVDEYISAIKEIAQKNSTKDGHVRILVTRGPGRPGLDPRNSDSPTVVISTYPLPAPKETIRLISSSVRRRGIANFGGQVKSLNYLNSIIAKQEAIFSGVDDALLLDDMGYVSEATAANILLIENGLIVVQSEWALDGITRRSVVEIAKEMDLSVKYARVTLSQLFSTESVLLTGTALGVVQVTELNGKPINSDSQTAEELKTAYRDALVDPNKTISIIDSK